jgi:hypothetical protein
MQQVSAGAESSEALSVPTRDQAHQQTVSQLYQLLRAREQVWLVSERYDAHEISWIVDMVRRGSMGRWVRQRYRYDAQPGTLHFRGERFIDEHELEAARAKGTLMRG